MRRIVWRDGIELPHDPNESEIYRWDWSDWLDGEVLSGTPQILADAGITAALYFLGTDYVDVRVSGGTVGTTYGVTVRATSDVRARVGDRTVRFTVLER